MKISLSLLVLIGVLVLYLMFFSDIVDIFGQLTYR
jgi:hypothetical protein